MAVGMLFGIGGTSMISRMLGEGKRDVAKNISAFCFWTGAAVGVIAMVFMYIFAVPISRLIGASDATVGYASQYLKIVSVSLPFLIVSNSFSNIIRSEGRANIAMAGTIIGNIINIVFDPIMILAFGWNVAGAAIATVLGNIFSAVFYVIHLTSKRSILSINIKDYTLKKIVVTGVLSIGVPASLNNILMSFSNIFINSFMAKHGDLQLAGLGVAMKVNMIAVMLLIGVGIGIQPLLGYCFGAGNRKRYLSVLKFSLCFAIVLSIVMTSICYFGAAPLAKAFLDDEEAFSYAFAFSRIYILSGPVLGILFVFINAIQSMGAAVPALIMSVSRQGIIYFPILITVSIVANTPTHLAMVQPITDYISVVLATVLFIMSYRKYFKAKQV
jgi:putative MATE family efflux protein